MKQVKRQTLNLAEIPLLLSLQFAKWLKSLSEEKIDKSAFVVGDPFTGESIFNYLIRNINNYTIGKQRERENQFLLEKLI